MLSLVLPHSQAVSRFMLLFPERLRARRRALKLTQKQLAEMVGVSPGAIGMYETGQRSPDLEMVRRLAVALDTSMSYLIGETDDPRPVGVREEAAHDTRPYSAHLAPDPEDILDLERAVRQANEILQRMKRRQQGDN